MRDGWRRVPLGKVAKLDIDRVRVEPSGRYRVAGVLNAGQGLFGREAIDGRQTNYAVLHRLRAGQLVMRKLTAWEGPIACVPEAYEGFFVSAEFPTFTLGPELMPSYMSLLCQRPDFWEAMKDRSTGSVQRRKRVSPSQLLSITVDLPPLADQRRIVDLLAAADTLIDAADRLALASIAAVRAIREELIDWSADLQPLASLCSIESRLVDPTKAEFRDLNHIGIERIEARTGRLLDLKSAAEDGVTSGKFLVDERDLVYSKIRPELQKAVFPGVQALCSADAYPLRPSAGVDPSFLLELLLSDRFSQKSIGKSGRTKMPKVNRRELMSIAVPFPDPVDQARVGGLASGLRGVANAAASCGQTVRALKVALLAEVIRGDHEIPTSYDRLIDTAA